MQLLLVLLASTAVAVACLPMHDIHESKDQTLAQKNTTKSQVVYPQEVIDTTQLTKSAQKTKTASLNDKPKMISNYKNPITNPPRKLTTQKPTTTSTTVRSWDYYDYHQDFPNNDANGDSTHSKMTSSHGGPPLCPGDGFVCQRDCERQNYYSGYCDGSHCICYGKLAG